MRVAVVDTGVNFGHPHVARPARGCRVGYANGHVEVEEGACEDGAGHGTCVAARILELAPDAEIDAIRAVGTDLRARGDDLAAAIETAVERGARIVNVSVGTHDLRFADRLRDAVRRALEAGAWVVAAAPEGERVLPASLVGVVAVGAGPPGSKAIARRLEGFPLYVAPPEARRWEGRTNFQGPSLAAAFVTAHLARGEPLPERA